MLGDQALVFAMFMLPLLVLCCYLHLQDLPEDAPVLILFPGLTGGSGDSYVQHAVLQARHAGVRAAVFNSRGTADSPVLTPQFYSASFTDDTREVGCELVLGKLEAGSWKLAGSAFLAYTTRRKSTAQHMLAGWSPCSNLCQNFPAAIQVCSCGRCLL